MRYTAKLTGNKRETHLAGKVLLIDIIDESGKLFRDHNWVKISNRLFKYMPKGHHHPVDIQFTATAKEYLSSEGIKMGLCHIRSITLK